MRVVKALVAVFTVVALCLLGLFWLAKYRLEHARFTEALAVVVSAPGYSVSTGEAELAERIEQALARVQGLESMRTEVRAGTVVVKAEVTAVGVDARHPVELVNEALSGVQRSLPEDAEQPQVMRVDPAPPTRHFLARSETKSRLELSRWLDEEFRRKVEVQPGARAIRLCGAVDPVLKITLDQDRLRAVGLSAGAVLGILEASSLSVPGGRVTESAFVVRLASRRLEDLEALELVDFGGGRVRLRDVARLEHTGEEPECTSAGDVVVSVVVMPGSELTFPSHPSITLTPFTPKRTAVFLSAPGVSMREALRALQALHPSAAITAERDELMVRFAEEPPRLSELPPGLALRSMDDRHAVIHVSGPDFDQLQEFGARARALLSAEKARWVGAVWPGLAPEQVMRPARGVSGLAELLQLVIGGVHVGRLGDGTPVRVHLGTTLEELVLEDGRRATDVLQITHELAPAAMLRVNGRRAVELEAGLEPEEARRVLSSLPLPPGYSVTVTER